jgi:CheY-like chemotaxis protein
VPRILLIEDDANHADLIQIVLERGALEAEWVTRSAEALAVLQSRPIDLIWVDLYQVQAEDFTFLISKNSDPILSDIPIVGQCATFHIYQQSQDQMRALGMEIDREFQGFIHSPFGIAEAIAIIRDAMEISHTD